MEHRDVRVTLDLDDAVARRLRTEVRSSGKRLSEVVNDYLRRALPLEVRPRDLGALWPGLSLDQIGDVLDTAEGPLHR